MKKLSTKIWVLIVIFLVITVLFMYVLTDFLYQQLYVDDTEQMMIEVGTKLQTLYDGGKVTEDLITSVETYSQYSNLNVFAVRNPKELSACVPFDVDYDTLIGPDERQKLLNGEDIVKIGYEPRFERQVISVVIPLTDQNRLEGIIYLYYPLAKISELANQEVIFLLGSAFIFMFIMAYLVHYGLRRIMRPLKELQGAVEMMSQGHYETRVVANSKDEIGKLSKAFNEMAEAIQRKDEEEKTFLATVSHELRTPISYIKGYSEALQNNMIEDNKKDETIALIAREANRMGRLTNEIMQLAHHSQDTAKEPIQLYPIPLAETLRETAYILERKADSKSITLHLDVDDDIIVEADDEKLKQIFINLIENAINYSHEGSIVQVKCFAEGQHAIIAIRDNGIGIPAEDIPRLTERFYRVNKARSRADGGSGLGLSIVEQLIKEQYATMKIESELGVGTVVTIRMPKLEDL